MDTSVVSTEERATFATMVKPDAPPPAPPPAGPAPAPPAAAPPAAAVPPAEPPITLEDLAELTSAALEKLEKIEAAQPPAPPTQPAGMSPERQAVLDSRRALLETAESPAVAEALRAGWAAQDNSERALQRIEVREQKDALASAEQEQANILIDEARELVSKFPGVTETDIQKVFDRIATDEKARRKGVWQVAELVLGIDYLDARRHPPGVPAGGNSQTPPTPPPASVVTVTGGGAPAAGPPGPAPRAGAGEGPPAHQGPVLKEERPDVHAPPQGGVLPRRHVHSPASQLRARGRW